MNKKLIGSLIGGGVTILTASLGGIKLSENLDYNKKVSYYEKISSQFKAMAHPGFVGEYFPPWGNMQIWGKQWENRRLSRKNDGSSKALNYFEETWPTPKSFRDWCYKKAEEDVKKNFGDCNTSHGYCVECTRTESWDTEKQN